jgi:hypothetical protein
MTDRPILHYKNTILDIKVLGEFQDGARLEAKNLVCRQDERSDNQYLSPCPVQVQS